MQSSGYLVIPLCALVLEIEICQNSGMRDLSKPIEEMSTYSFFFFPPFSLGCLYCQQMPENSWEKCSTLGI